jgi:phosphate butyryltransferase
MPLPAFSELFARLDALRPEVAVVAAGGADTTVLEALSLAAQRGWVKPLLTGDLAEMQALAARLQIDTTNFQLIAAEQPAREAVRLIRAGQARMLMKGQIATPDLMKAVLDRETGLRTGEVIGQIVLMELPRDNRRLLLTDTGICIAPSREEKLGLARQALRVARELGLSEPSVAFMAATEKANPNMPDTVDSAELAAELSSGQHGPCHAAGPLSFDLAYADDAGQKKRIEGDVVGAADILLFPNLLSANLTVKAIMYTADCRFGGLLCGTTAPVVFMSRADSTETRLHSLAYTITADLARREQS